MAAVLAVGAAFSGTGRIRRRHLAALETDSSGSVVLCSGILLLIPGFITDVIASLFLVAPLRPVAAAARAAAPGDKNSGTRCRTLHAGSA